MCGEGEAEGGESPPTAPPVPAPDAQRPRDSPARSAARRCAGAGGCAAALGPSRLAHGAPRGAVGSPMPYVSPPRPPRGVRGRRRAGAGAGGQRPSGRSGARPRHGARHGEARGGRWALGRVGGSRSCPVGPMKLFSHGEQPEPRSPHLLSLFAVPAPAEGGRAGLAMASPGRPGRTTGLPSPAPTRGVQPPGAPQPARTGRSLRSAAGLIRF